MNNIKKTEILAPVGNMDMLYAAVKGGCDAVYLGGKLFSARAFADNFSIEDIKNIVEYCHLNNVKVYVAVNILIHDYEIKDALKYVYDLYNIDVDALIIQDLGLASLINKNLPDFDLHASTQINIYNEYGARQLKDMGFKRVVLSRETPYKEIKRIKENVDIELEVFIHGSLCVATSGQCLMSSYIGGRSGNRGKCAQPCRKNYTVYNSDFKIIDSNEKAYLSTKDLCTYEDVKKLSDIGVDSLKIEGRMKKPEYVFTVVKEYKEKISGINHSTDDLIEVSNRGFTKGLIFDDYGINFAEVQRGNFSKGITVGEVVYTKNTPGIIFTQNMIKGDILNVESDRGRFYQITLTKNYNKGDRFVSDHIYDAKNKSEVRRISSRKIKNNLENALKQKSFKDINMKFIGKMDDYPKLYLYYNNKVFEAKGTEKITKALNRPVDKENIYNQLSKIKDTDYSLSNLSIDIDENIFLPLKTLNKLRRNVINQLENSRSNFNDRMYKDFNKAIIKYSDNKEYNDKKNINIELMDNKLIERINTKIINDIYIQKLEDMENIICLENNIFYKLPRFASSDDLFELKKNIDKYINNIDGFLINNLGDIKFIQENYSEKIIIGDYGLNILNGFTLSETYNLKINRSTLSTELNIEEIKSITNFNIGDSELIISGYLTSMIMIQCPFSIIKKCKDTKGCKNCNYAKGYYLKDEFKEMFKVIRINNYTELFNSKKLETIDFIEELKKLRINNYRIIVDESSLDSDSIEDYYNALNNYSYKNIFSDYTKGHYYRGIK